MRTPVALIAVPLILLTVIPVASAATTTEYYRALCTAADGSPIGLAKVAEEDLGNGSGYRFVHEDGALVRIDTLRDGTRVSSSRAYEDGRLVREAGLGKDGPTHERTYGYDESGRLARETYTRTEKGKDSLLWTKEYLYDEAGTLTTIVDHNETSGSRFETRYQDGVEVERCTYDKQNRLTHTRRYLYGPRVRGVWEEEQELNRDGRLVRTKRNAMLEAGAKVERRPAQVQKTDGDEEIKLTEVEITNPFFSPTNSPHRKDDTRISACIWGTRPLVLEVYAEDVPEPPMFVDRRPQAGGRGFFHFHWAGVSGVGDMVVDGRYPFIVRTPIVRAWAVRLWAKRRYTQEPLLCVSSEKAYVYDGVQGKVLVFTADGELDREIELASYPGWGTQSFYPSSMDVTLDGRILLSRGNTLYVYDDHGNFLHQIDVQLEGLLRAVGWGVDEQGGVCCVAANSRRITRAGKTTYYDDYAVLKLDETGRTERVVVDGSGFFPDAKPFIRGGTLYVNFWHHAETQFQRYLGIVDLATGDMKLLPRTGVVNDVMQTTAGEIYVEDGAMFRDPARRLVRGFDCGSGCSVLSGDRLYATGQIGTELRCYELASDRVLLEDVLVVDNTTPTAEITYPGSQGLVAGSPDRVDITGTATDLNFEKYEVYWRFATVRHARWRLLKESDAPCDGGALAVWDTTTSRYGNIKERDIELKLIVTDKAGNTIEEPFSVRYDADDDGFSNEFENSNKELDRNTKTERCTAEVLPDIITLLTRQFPINGQGRIGVQLVDAETREYLDEGLLEFRVNAGTIQRRARISRSTATAHATWQTPDGMVAPATLHVELPPQGINNVWYTAEPMEMDFVLVVDSDFDGLTDDEENSIAYPDGLKTSPTNADTDGDGVDDYRDLSPTDAPAVQFSEEYAPGELRFTQTYRILALAGSQATVIKNDRNMGRDAIMDKEITDETVKEFFNDKVFKVDSDNEDERSPLHVETATNTKTFIEEHLHDFGYTAAAGWPHYDFKYYLEQYLYELTVTNREATSFPLGYGPKYGTIKLDVAWRSWGDNAIVVQFLLNSGNRWRDKDETGNSTKMFLKYELYGRDKVAEELPHHTGLAAVDRVEGNLFQCIIRVPFREACPMNTAIGTDQTVVLTPLWVRHKGGNLKCMYKNHPDITPDREECLFCGYRPVRDEFIPVSTRNITLSAWAHQYNHYSYCVIGRRTARAGGPPIDPNTDYDTLTAIFDQFHPARRDGPHPANGIVPMNIGGRSYSILFCENCVTPGVWHDFDPAQFIYDNMPNADAVVLRSNSSMQIDFWLGRLQDMLRYDGPVWNTEWILIPEGATPPQLATAGTVTDEGAADAQADSALDKIQTVGARLKTIRETAEFFVDCSNMPLVARADQLAGQTTLGTMQVGNSIYNVVAEKLGEDTFEVQLQHTTAAVGNKVRGRTTLVRKEQVDDITDSKIATQYGVVNKLPTALLATAKIGTALMTDGVDCYQAFRTGDYFEAGYHGVRCGSRVTLAVVSVAWKNSPLLKTIQITKFAKFNVTEAVVSGIEVAYHVINAVRADSWLERSQAVEKAVAAAIDGAIGCVEPYGAAITLSWDASVWATNKICDKFGIGESTELSQSATSSIGSAAVFLFKDLSPFTIPTQHANNAYTRAKKIVEKKVSTNNSFFDERNRDDPRWVFVPPDPPKR